MNHLILDDDANGSGVMMMQGLNTVFCFYQGGLLYLIRFVYSQFVF